MARETTNPLLEVHTREGVAGVDRWLSEQTTWSNEELAVMLRDLAVEIMTRKPDEDSDDGSGDVDDVEEDEEDVEVDEDDRPATVLAAEVLVARAAAGQLDPRAIARLRPLLDEPRGAAIDILGAARDPASVPALIRVVQTVADEDLVARAAIALGRIADRTAIPVLSQLATTRGDHRERARVAAAAALLACGVAVSDDDQDIN